MALCVRGQWCTQQPQRLPPPPICAPRCVPFCCSGCLLCCTHRRVTCRGCRRDPRSNTRIKRYSVVPNIDLHHAIEEWAAVRCQSRAAAATTKAGSLAADDDSGSDSGHPMAATAEAAAGGSTSRASAAAAEQGAAAMVHRAGAWPAGPPADGTVANTAAVVVAVAAASRGVLGLGGGGEPAGGPLVGPGPAPTPTPQQPATGGDLAGGLVLVAPRWQRATLEHELALEAGGSP